MLVETPIKNLIFEDKATIEQKLTDSLQLIEHPKLREAAGHLLSAGGKRIRPCMMSIAYKAAGGKDVDGILSVAVAMELIHNWSLVHDDIIDNSDTRRGRNTVHVQWDQTVAILAGDALLSLAYRVVAESGFKPEKAAQVMSILTKATMDLIDGEQLDVDMEEQAEVTEHDYFKMIAGKTGALFQAAAQIGALLATDDKAQVDAMERYGALVGLAFQLQDDLLDLTANQAELGKEIGKDIKEGKRTLIVLHALKNATEEQKAELEALLGNQALSALEVTEAVAILDRIGSIDQVRKVLNDTTTQAKEVLLCLPDNIYKESLSALADHIAGRAY